MSGEFNESEPDVNRFYFYEIGCILKIIYYIYHVVDHFPRVVLQGFDFNSDRE